MGLWDFLGVTKKRDEKGHEGNRAPGRDLIERPTESGEYLQGWSIAGARLQSMFKQCSQKFADEHMGFCWLRTDIISPTFDSMNFRYKNRVFSVLVDIVAPVHIADMKGENHGHGYGISVKTALGSLTAQKAKNLQIDICHDNDMVPCLFSIARNSMSPMEEGWNLRHTQTGELIIPTDIADESLRQVSAWELLNWGISFVMDDLREKGNKILSFTDVPGVVPQLWFENPGGERCWAQVAVNSSAEVADFSGTAAADYKGYIAKVMILPIGSGKLYRSRPANIMYTGLKEV